ncbi:hypothetical protein GGR51DRAFT_553120 [Nemania sp. FL0031]|nr:hypothetical protein GGR51DRAFT_553120 [Nemania sp. FL0031]
MLPRIQRADTAATAPEQPDREFAQMKSIINEIKAIYNQGTPLFTKEAIRKVGQELEICKTITSGGRYVTLRGINGMDYTDFVNLPPEQTVPEGELLYVGGSTWIIDYRSIECLTRETDVAFFFAQPAYPPMKICACTRTLSNPFAPYEIDLRVSSTEELLEAFRDIERKWRTSHYYQQLQAALAKVNPPFVLDKIFGVALGHLTSGTRLNHDSVLQHILLSAIHSNFIEHNVLSVSSKRYVQDPAYSQQHRDALFLAEFTVLEDPHAFLALDNSSVLLSINPDIPVKQIVADICCPGVIIWTKKVDDSVLRTDPESSRVDKLIEQNYHELDFPFHKSFGDLVMYVRKTT